MGRNPSIARYRSSTPTNRVRRIFSVASLDRPRNPTLDYDGVSYVSPTIWAGPKSNGMTDNPQLTPIVRTKEFKIPSDRNVQIFFNGRSRILPNADGTATFLETPVLDRYPSFEAIGRVEKTGQVVETPLSFHAADIAKGPDARVWILGSTENGARPSAIYRLNDDGTTTKKYAFWYQQTGPMILGPDGDFWVIADVDHKSIGAEQISPDGKVMDFRIGANENDLTDLVAGNDGNVWYVGDGSLAPGLSPGSDFVRVSPKGKYAIFRSPQNNQGCGGYPRRSPRFPIERRYLRDQRFTMLRLRRQNRTRHRTADAASSLL